MVVPQDTADVAMLSDDVAMLAGIGPDRKLFDTSLSDSKTE
jgi:hypothetical protein